ncbi:hypothetical protein CN204_01035 [Sinorhizobium meliloti]|nr:hypothetical protein SMRU11_10080 [Sinorhizobium meliloti RU11/001]MDW9579969.1 hypothetical protein [Sinorhizobium meliloti]MDX0200527.1 hypothetical protein [Sinorhizobium meliloti]MDX0235128.1 hypothetical protein [Sinorhizobium meliloti]MQW82946.1 hypothetical protein [Sinorhizobium meliloti]
MTSRTATSLFCGSGGRRRSVIHLFSRDLAQGKVPAGHGLDRLSRTACDSSTLLRATSMQRCIGIAHFRRGWRPQARSTAPLLKRQAAAI